MASSRDRGARQQLARFRARRVLLLAEFWDVARAGVESGERRTSQSGSSRAARGSPPRPCGALSTRAISTHRHEVARDRQEPLALGGGMRHRAQMQVRHVAHVDHAERQPRQPGIAPSIMRCTSRIDVE